jgi:hypothetical protein
MASSINASTSGAGGVITTADNTGILNLQTAGTTAVTVDASQNVSVPAGYLFVGGGVTNYGSIYLNSTTTVNPQIRENAGAIAFLTNSSERMRIDSSGNLLFNSGYGSVATAYGCRAWVNFNGTGTVAIRASGNVSSITDNGTGDYTVNFTNAMPDANYSVVVSGNLNVTTNSARVFCAPAFQAPTTSTIRIACSAPNTSNEDQEFVHVAIFR